MGNFEKLSVLVIVVIIVMILVVALFTLQDSPSASHESADNERLGEDFRGLPEGPIPVVVKPDEEPAPDPGPARLENPWDEYPAPTPEPTPTPEPEPAVLEPIKHVIQSGDTLSGIAQRYAGSTRYVPWLRELNPGLGRWLVRGEHLFVPSEAMVAARKEADGTGQGSATPSTPWDKSKTTYTTRAGDTWKRISQIVYKTKKHWPLLFGTNSKLHDSATQPLPAGLELQLPQLR